MHIQNIIQIINKQKKFLKNKGNSSFAEQFPWQKKLILLKDAEITIANVFWLLARIKEKWKK